MNFKVFAVLAVLALAGSAAAARKRVTKKDVGPAFPTVADALVEGNYTQLVDAATVRWLAVASLEWLSPVRSCPSEFQAQHLMCAALVSNAWLALLATPYPPYPSANPASHLPFLFCSSPTWLRCWPTPSLLAPCSPPSTRPSPPWLMRSPRWASPPPLLTPPSSPPCW